MDRDKVIRIIDELIVEAQKAPTWKAENALRCLKKELLEEQESILEMPNDDGWISVEDHLPEEEGRYIAYSRDEGRDSCAFSVGEAHYCHVGRDDERKWRGSYGLTYDVTHWRPFPPPPKFHEPAQNERHSEHDL